MTCHCSAWTRASASTVPPAGRSPTSSRRNGSPPIPATRSSADTSASTRCHPTAWPLAVAAGFTPEDQRTPEQHAALTLAADLTDELLRADAILLAVPLYNFGVSQHIKAWFDLVMTDQRAKAGPLLPGKPVVLATVRGGAYGTGTPREGWDHSTGYLRRMLADVWSADLTVVEREFTLVGVNPALDEFRDLAHEMHASALSAAGEAARVLAKAAAVA